MTYTTQIVERYIGHDEPDSAANFLTYTLTTDHASSSYGVPVLVGPDGVAYGPMDILPNGEIAATAALIADWEGAAIDAVNKFRQV